MSFHYAKERAKFDREWEKLRRQYKNAGMIPEAIEEMYQYDLRFFNSCRKYYSHTQQMPETIGVDTDENKNSTLFRKYSALSVTFNDTDLYDRYSWLESSSNPQIQSIVGALTLKDKELLTLLYCDGKNQDDISKEWGCTQQAVSKRLQKIKKYFN